MQLIATKQVKYAKVLYNPGDRFEATDEDARMLKGWGKARNADGSADEAEPAGDVEALRGRYRTMTGRDPDMRWGVGRLQRETSGPGTYGRRDMRAED